MIRSWLLSDYVLSSMPFLDCARDVFIRGQAGAVLQEGTLMEGRSRRQTQPEYNKGMKDRGASRQILLWKERTSGKIFRKTI